MSRNNTTSQRLLEGDNISLRALEPEDLPFLYKIENDPLIWHTSNSTMPYSRFFLKQYIETQQGDLYADKQLRLIISEKETQESVGIIDLFEFNPQHRRAELGIVIDEKYRNRGYGQEAIALLLDYSFKHIHLHQVVAKVAITNETSIELFKRCGFVDIATLPEWMLTPTGYADVKVLQKLA